MHGRPRDYKKKLADPAAQAGYKKKVRHATAVCCSSHAPRTHAHTHGMAHVCPPAHHPPQVDAIRNGTALILSCRKAKRYDDVAMDASGKLLKVVPEVGATREGMAQHAARTHAHTRARAHTPRLPHHHRSTRSGTSGARRWARRSKPAAAARARRATASSLSQRRAWRRTPSRTRRGTTASGSWRKACAT